jgi:probable F420-dependent oxidoreductase
VNIRPFRFGALVGAAATRREWLDQVRLAEKVGCSTVFCSDHVSDKLGPIPALASAAEITHLKVGTLVLANDFRNPVLVAKDAATLDLLSEGRLELGLGTGWLADDYARAGIRLDPPGVRIDRFEEAIRIMKGLWRGRVDFEGDHYSVHWEGMPRPYRPGGPTLLIGGGGPRMLRLAGREADIVGISLKLPEGSRDELRREIASVTAERLDARVGWAREAGRDPELNVVVFHLEVTGRVREAAARLGEPAAVMATPHYLVGTVDGICEELEERRRRWGISYIVISQDDLVAAAPVIERLAGR